ncbi:MAG TPA: zinc-ribbon and DUF3426 domain-containing protein [Cellvibrionaceae bacterium]
MADMITRCPQCATAFRITAAHLKLAQGSVRCGACFTIFNALENLSERTTQNSPASNLADDFLISDHMGIEDDAAENSTETTNKSSLFERVEKAKAQPEKTEEADESWAIALLTEEGLGEPLVAEDEFIEEEPSFRPFQVDANAKPIELSDDFLKATQSAELTVQPEAGSELAKNTEAFVTSLAQEHPELNAEDLQDLHEALQSTRIEPAAQAKVVTQESLSAAAPKSSRNTTAPGQSSSSHNAHLIERIELDALEVTFRHRKGLSAQFWWSAGCLAALLILFIQVAIIKMPQWRYDTPLSGIYTLACQKLTCPKDSRVDASKIQTKSLLVREHPTHPGAFAVDAVIVNKASFVQPFPRLILSFRNLQNQLINERIFLPAEYLGGEMAGEQNMPIKQEIRIGLEIVDPGKDAVSYNLSAD